jgi:hypothetical protein
VGSRRGCLGGFLCLGALLGLSLGWGAPFFFLFFFSSLCAFLWCEGLFCGLPLAETGWGVLLYFILLQ